MPEWRDELPLKEAQLVNRIRTGRVLHESAAQYSWLQTARPPWPVAPGEPTYLHAPWRDLRISNFFGVRPRAAKLIYRGIICKFRMLSSSGFQI